jgi:predicted MarR family transcription regulator
MFVKETLKKRPMFLEDLKRSRRKELEDDMALANLNDIEILENSLCKVAAFFLIEMKLNKEIEGYDSIQDLWEFFSKKFRIDSLKFCQAETEDKILELKKRMHFVAVCFNQKNYRHLNDDMLNCKQQV